MTPRRLLALLTAVLVAGLVVTGCGGGPGQADTTAQRQDTPTADPALVDEALRFGGIVLPPSAQVLGVHHERGPDQLYRLVLRVDADELPTLLAASQFTTQLTAGATPLPHPIDGFELDGTKTLRSGKDSLPPGDGRTHLVFREIVIDETDPASPLVHLWLFTT
ncbi:MAG TPA: hypothetical protein VIL00_01595 [Pseudonocardiaceae bacterium]